MKEITKSLDVKCYEKFFDVLTHKVSMLTRMAELKCMGVPFIMKNGVCTVNCGNPHAALVFDDNNVRYYLEGKEVLRGLEYTYCTTRALVDILMQFEKNICWEEFVVKPTYKFEWQKCADGILDKEKENAEYSKKMVWMHYEEDFRKEWYPKYKKVISVFESTLKNLYGDRLGSYSLYDDVTPYDEHCIFFKWYDDNNCIWKGTGTPFMEGFFNPDKPQEFLDLTNTIDEFLANGKVDHNTMAKRPRVVVYDEATCNEISLMIKRHADADPTYWRPMWKNLDEFCDEWCDVLSDNNDDLSYSYERSEFYEYLTSGKLNNGKYRKWRRFCESVMRMVWNELQKDMYRPLEIVPYKNLYQQGRYVKTDKLRYKGLYVLCTPYLKEGLQVPLKWINHNKKWTFYA